MLMRAMMTMLSQLSQQRPSLTGRALFPKPS
jgi:hypothetical protein